MQYKLIASAYKADLESSINKKLAEGWQLHGVTFKHANKLHQAMVKQTACKVEASSIPAGVPNVDVHYVEPSTIPGAPQPSMEHVRYSC